MGIIQTEYSWQEGGAQDMPAFRANSGTSSSEMSDHQSIAAESVGAATASVLSGELLSVLNDDPGYSGGPTSAGGTANAWMTPHDAHSGAKYAVSRAYRSRLAVDAEVSRLLAAFWTTFAAHGDPNGQPSHSSGSMNGYVPGTRQDDTPWWPRLLGDIAAYGDNDDIFEQESAGVVDASDVDTGAAGFEEWSHDNAQTLYGTGERDGEAMVEDLLRPAPPRTAVTVAPRAAVTRRTGSTLIGRAHTALERLRDHRYASQQYMHHMVFDEETSVNIIENDCICNAWNQLEYRF
jgi:hypothetical protein